MAYQHILVPVDGSETSYKAVSQAAALAHAFNAKVTIVQILTLDPYIAAEYITAQQTNDLIERARNSILKDLDDAKNKFAEYGITADTALLEGQNISAEIIKAANAQGADLIVIGSHGRTGIKKLFLGSVAQSILGEAEIPVLIVRK
jgi:nucleotide-binding universal stress UspA family protein